MAAASPPNRTVLVFSGLFTQLIGAACLVLGLASFPVMHDLHRPIHVVIAWVLSALGALICGGLSYRARIVPLGLAAVIDAGFALALPRKDSALGALAQLLPQADVGLAETVVSVVSVVMFVTAALCIVSIPLAVRYRRWEATPDGIRLSQSMMAVVPDSADTLRGVGKVGGKPAMTTLVLHTSALDRRSRPWVIFLVAATLVGTGAAVMFAGGGSAARRSPGTGKRIGAGPSTADGGPKPDARIGMDAGGASPGLDAPSPAPVADSPENLVLALHDAISRGDATALSGVLALDVYAIGADADELADGRDGALAVLARDVGAVGPVGVEATHTTIAHDGKLAWIGEELALTPAAGAARHYVTTVIATQAGGKWVVAALTWAVAVPDKTAFHLARLAQLPLPAPVADRTMGATELAEAARAAFGSRDGFAAARSKRADGFNYGSAPGERMVGGDGIRRAFARMPAQLALHDGVSAGLLGDRGGWSETNVDFTAPDRDGTAVTQTFRVMAAWLHEPDGWRIVHTQFSNARPR